MNLVVLYEQQIVTKENRFCALFEAGLFESKIRIRYACVHLGGLQRRYLALTRSSIMLIVLGWVGVASCFHVSSLLG